MNTEGKGFKIATICPIQPIDVDDGDPVKGVDLYMDPDKIHELDFSDSICPYCNKSFSSRYNRNVHVSKSCKMALAKKYIDLQENQPGQLTMGRELNLSPGFVIESAIRKSPREIIFVCGPQGAGKSMFCRKYITAYQDEYPDNEIFVFSRLEKDNAFNGLDIQRIQMDDSLVEEPIDMKQELLKTLCVFDDYIFPHDKQLTDSIEALITDIILHGRDQENQGNDIYCVITGHQIRNYRKTRDILNECTSIVIYPGSNIPYQITKFLKDYLQLKQTRIRQILSLPSRWVQIYTGYPQYVLHEKGGFILRDSYA